MSKTKAPASRQTKAASSKKAAVARKPAPASRSTSKTKTQTTNKVKAAAAPATRASKAPVKGKAVPKPAARVTAKTKPAVARPGKAKASPKPEARVTAKAKGVAAPARSSKAPAKSKAAPKPATRSTVKANTPAPAAKQNSASKAQKKVAEPKQSGKATDPMTTKTKIQEPMTSTVAKKPSKAASRAAAARIEPPPAPDMSSLVGSSRFADRFAPPKPPTRQMNSTVIEIPRVAAKPDPKLANAWKTKSGREMSEAEIFAMPDKEYMNEQQLDFFRGKLLKLKEDLLSNAGETTEHLREDTSIVPDPADRATIEEEHALELRTRDRERKLLKKITQSLARLESGDYGYCDETGEPIGLGRLIARPTANLSLEAQQRRELKQKMFGD